MKRHKCSYRKKININTNNFKSIQSIKQIVYILKVYLGKNVTNSKIVKQNSIQILIENFDKKDVSKIIDLKKKKNIKLILLLTEFFENNNLNEDTNLSNFNKPLNIFVFLLKKFNSGKLLKVKNYFKKNMEKKFFRLKKYFYKFFSSNIYYKYMQNRLNNIEKLIPHIDLFLVAHPEIKKKLKVQYGLSSHLILPILPKIKKNLSREKKIKISGQINKYRYEKILKISDYIYKFNKLLKNKVINNNKRLFLNVRSRNFFFYSLHLKKNQNWSYDSPFRYFYSIMKNEIPIVIDNFSNNNSRLITLKIDNLNKLEYLKVIKNYKYIVNIFNNKIKKYNHYAILNKIKFQKKLHSLLKEI